MSKSTHLKYKLGPNDRPTVAKGQKVTRGDIIIKKQTRKIFEFPLAKILGVTPNKISKYLGQVENTLIKLGEVIARKPGFLSKRVVKAPIPGKLIVVDKAKGIVGIEHEDKQMDIKAWFEGIVTDVTPSEITFSPRGVVITGNSGSGLPVTGTLLSLVETVSALTMPIAVENCVLALKTANSDVVAKADALGAVAIVAETLEETALKLPYLIVADIQSVHPHQKKTVVVFGDGKQLLVLD